jgi:hypothetical protein
MNIITKITRGRLMGETERVEKIGKATCVSNVQTRRRGAGD